MITQATFANAVRGLLPKYASNPVFNAARKANIGRILGQSQVEQVIQFTLWELIDPSGESNSNNHQLEPVIEVEERTIRDDTELLAKYSIRSWEELATADISVQEAVKEAVFDRDMNEANKRFSENSKAALARMEERNAELRQDKAKAREAAEAFSQALRSKTPPLDGVPATDLSRQDTRPPWDILRSNGFHPRKTDPVEAVRQLLHALHLFSNIPEATREYKKTNGNLGALIGAVATSKGASYLNAGQSSSGPSTGGVDYTYALKSLKELDLRELTDEDLRDAWKAPGKPVVAMNKEIKIYISGNSLETAERIAVFHGSAKGGDELTFLTPIKASDILAWKIATTNDLLLTHEVDIWYEFNAGTIAARIEFEKQRDTYFTLTG
jgi:hypothetical protein